MKHIRIDYSDGQYNWYTRIKPTGIPVSWWRHLLLRIAGRIAHWEQKTLGKLDNEWYEVPDLYPPE